MIHADSAGVYKMDAATQSSVQNSSCSNLHDLSPKQYVYSITALVVLGAAFRFLGLGTRALWTDEAFSWAMTRLTWREFYSAISRQAADMTVYYTVLKIWTVFGDSEFVLRSLSAIVSVVTIPLVAEVGRRLYSRKAGTLAATGFAVHVFSIRYAQEARSYALVMLLACVSWLLLSRIIVDPSNCNLFWFGAVSVLTIYSHPISGLNLAAQLLTVTLYSRAKAIWRPVSRTVAGIALYLVPAILYSIHHRHDLSWIQPTKWPAVREFLDEVAGGIGSRVYLAIVTILFTTLIVHFLRLWRTNRKYELWASSVPVFGFALPVAALITISILQPTFVGRYVGFVLLPLLWGVGELFSRTKGLFFWISASLLLLVLIKPLPDYYRNFAFQKFRFQDFRGAVKYIGQQQYSGDCIIAWPAYARPGLDYYGSQISRFPAYIYPNAGTHFDPGDVLIQPDARTLAKGLAQQNHIWLVISKNNLQYSSSVLASLQTSLGTTHRLISERDFLGLTVAEYRLTSP
jgi:hypothetical protein